MSQENLRVVCPCCTAVVSFAVSGYAQTTIHDPHYRVYYPDESHNTRAGGSRSPQSPRSPRSPQPTPKWLSPGRDQELRNRWASTAAYCICQTGAHDDQREDAYPCSRCHTVVCSHTKCRHSHEIYDCSNEVRKKLKYPSSGYPSSDHSHNGYPSSDHSQRGSPQKEARGRAHTYKHSRNSRYEK